MFIPTGGVKGMSPIINILYGRDSKIPPVILDSDKPGRDKEKSLLKSLYKDNQNKVITVKQLLGEGDYELEDILPKAELSRVFSKLYRGVDIDFDYTFDKNEPIIDQMEEFAKENRQIRLEQGWKVELAAEFSRVFSSISNSIEEEVVQDWDKLFQLVEEALN